MCAKSALNPIHYDYRVTTEGRLSTCCISSGIPQWCSPCCRFIIWRRRMCPSCYTKAAHSPCRALGLRGNFTIQNRCLGNRTCRDMSPHKKKEKGKTYFGEKQCGTYFSSEDLYYCYELQVVKKTCDFFYKS